MGREILPLPEVAVCATCPFGIPLYFSFYRLAQQETLKQHTSTILRSRHRMFHGGKKTSRITEHYKAIVIISIFNSGLWKNFALQGKREPGVREAESESLFPILIARVLRWSPPSQVLSKAVANNQLKPKKGLNSKINGRLIDSIRLDSARLLGFVLFLIQSSGSLQPCNRVRETKKCFAP